MGEKERHSEMVKWLRLRHACDPGIKWAIENCEHLDDAWTKAPDEWLCWLATRYKVLANQTLREAACFCARWGWESLPPEFREAIELGEKYTRGGTSLATMHAKCVAIEPLLVDQTLYSPKVAAWATTFAAAQGAYSVAFRSGKQTVGQETAYRRMSEWFRANAKPKW